MIFEVTPEHIEALSDSDLRTLVGYLAEQETVRAGHSPSNVTYGGHQNAKDGGIDVRVDLKNLAIADYIPRTQSGFQVKAEDMSASAIQQEMCPGGKLRRRSLSLARSMERTLLSVPRALSRIARLADAGTPWLAQLAPYPRGRPAR